MFAGGLAGALLAACGQGNIPPQQKYATVFGRVYDEATNSPVPGAVVTVLVVLRAVSGADGSYSVPNVPSGQVDVTIDAPAGYTPVQPSDTFSVVPGDSFRLDVALRKS